MKIRTVTTLALAALAGAAIAWRYASRRKQLPCPTWLAWILENPWTETVGGTGTTLERIGLQPGESGLDIGCGPGRLAIPAARRVGPAGKIVAVDIQAGMLSRLQQRASSAGLNNIQAVRADVTHAGSLPGAAFDRAWLVTVLGEIPDQQAALREIYGALKPGGTLSITEILLDPHYQSQASVLRLCQEAGFLPTQHWGNLLAFTQNFIKSDKRL